MLQQRTSTLDPLGQIERNEVQPAIRLLVPTDRTQGQQCTYAVACACLCNNLGQALSSAGSCRTLSPPFSVIQSSVGFPASHPASDELTELLGPFEQRTEAAQTATAILQLLHPILQHLPTILSLTPHLNRGVGGVCCC